MTLSFNKAFGTVIGECAAKREAQQGTWITSDMAAAYARLHHEGWAHSVEVWRSDQLIGGLYGLAIGKVFFGESMFSEVSDASKIAMVGLVDILQRGSFELIDCQVESEHLNSLGARNVSRLDFERRLAQTVGVDHDPKIWRLPVNCGDLL